MIETGSAGHEKTDAQIRPVIIFGAVLAALVVLVLVSMIWMFDFFVGRWGASLPPASPSAEREQPALPVPRPLMPAMELNEMLTAEDSILNSYGWVERDKAVVRIPIERAMELLAERGLPFQATADMGQGKAMGARP